MIKAASASETLVFFYQAQHKRQPSSLSPPEEPEILLN
jgi:hypothetical protein